MSENQAISFTLSISKAKKVRDFVAGHPDEIELQILPPVSPELNPDEHVWNELKSGVVGQTVINGPDQLKSIMRSNLHRVQKPPDKIKSYIKSPETAYTWAYGT